MKIEMTRMGVAKLTSVNIDVKTKAIKKAKQGHDIMSIGGFPGGSVVKNPPANAGDRNLIPGSGRSLEKEMATHSSILAWEIPWTEKPSRLQSMRSRAAEHNRATESTCSQFKMLMFQTPV